MAEPEVTPKLLASTTGNAEGYAQISWTAVAALAVAIVFAVCTLALAVVAARERRSLLEPGLLVLPAFAVLLAFVARRQILGSEGTRTGLRYANAAWSIAAVGGLTYATYLFAVEFAVRNDAEREFLKYTSTLVQLDAANPQDPALYAAVYAMVPPGARGSVAGPADAAGLDAGFKDLVLGFRATELVRVCARNPGAVTFKATGLVDWEQKEKLITCTIKARMACPEGDFELVVPMRAEIEDNRQRRWAVTANKEGFVTRRRLTPYGWLVEGVEQSGRQFTAGLMTTLGTPGNANLALDAYVLPDSDPLRASKLDAAFKNSMPGRLAVAGAFATAPLVAPNAEATLAELFARPDGKPPTETDRRGFREAWTNPQRIMPPGAVLKANADTATQLTLRDGKISLAQAAEIVLSQEAQPPPAARAKVLLKLSAAAEAELVAEFDRLRAEAATAPRTDTPPEEFLNSPRVVAWRVARIVSDLKAVPVAREGPGGGPGGPGGGGGGMMGSR